jgi:hypothetical protein
MTCERRKKISYQERADAEEEVAEAMKAALLISGVDKILFRKLKEQLAINIC